MKKATGPSSSTTASRSRKRPYEPVPVNELAKKVSSVQDRSFRFFLSDPHLLDCPICFEPFTIPVFQCENGHVACSCCCKKLKKKCATCSLPIGSIRNRALEKVLKSIEVPCLNEKYGCNDTLSYREKCGHESNCFFAPCTCPHTDCEFVSSFFELPAHFGSEHGSSTVVKFWYSKPFIVTLKSQDEATILQEQSFGKLFILQNLVTSLGNAVNICFIQPNSMYDIWCEISSKFLVIPSDYFGSSEAFKLEICII